MLIVPPPKVRNHRKAAKRAAIAVPQLVLQSASYDPSESVLFLYFNEDIDSSALDGSSISVNDPVTNNKLYPANLDHMGNENYVEIQLNEQGPATSGDAVILNAGADTQIVGVSDGALWAGASGVVLPFSS